MGIVVGIDASNISSGGGLTHLIQLLAAADPCKSGVEYIHVITSSSTSRKLPKREWLICHTPPWCDAAFSRRMLGQQFQMVDLLKQFGCDVLFSPGGTLPLWCPMPTVTMSQNMLPFEPDRAKLFGRLSWLRLKMYLLRFSQGRSFRRSQGIIFLSEYAQRTITKALGGLNNFAVVIPHGIEPRFIMQPRSSNPARFYIDRPFRLLYVSIQLPYKHHIEVMSAIAQLRYQGLAVTLTMVGSHSDVYSEAVCRKRLELDPDQKFIHDLGHIDFEFLHDLYRHADTFLFASSCENLPNILIEAMAAGLPIASSNRGPMPEVLGDGGVYFDPESPKSIEQAIAQLANDPDLRSNLAKRASRMTKEYSWERCARETFNFVAHVA